MNWVARLDRWFERRFGIREIGEGGYILKLQIVRHRGPRFTFEDGTVVEPGDLVGELHISNERAALLHGEGRPGLRFRREVFRLLPALARDLRERPECRGVKALCGASLFWAEAERAGFENRPIPPVTRWWLTWWERFLLARYHPKGAGRLTEGRRTELRQTWLTRATLERLVAGGAHKSGRARVGKGRTAPRSVEPAPNPAASSGADAAPDPHGAPGPDNAKGERP